MSRLGSTLLALALSGALVLAAYADILMVAAAVLLIQLVIASAPSPANGRGRTVRSPRFGAAIAAGAVATTLALRPDFLEGADGTRAGSVGQVDNGVLAGILPAIAVGVFVALVAQMLRSDGRADLVRSVAYAASLGAFAALATGWIGAAQSLGGSDIVVVGTSGIAAGLLVWLAPADRWVMGSAAMVAAAGAGAGAALLLDGPVAWVLGIAVGSTAAVFAILGQELGRAWTSGRAHADHGWGFPGSLSIALAAPVVYIGGQLIGAGF